MTTALVSLASRPTEYGFVPFLLTYIRPSANCQNSTRIGLIFSASSIAVLFSFLLQSGLLASKNWAIPSAISGVFLSEFLSKCPPANLLNISLASIHGCHWSRLSVQNATCRPEN